MTVRILVGDVFARLAEMPADSVDCVVTSPPYWGLRDYGVDGQIGMEPTLGEHLDVMVRVFREVRRVLKPAGTLWLNYGDCYATKPNGRSAAATKGAGTDDRTFRDKPFSTIGPIAPLLEGETAGPTYAREHERDRRGTRSTLQGAPPPDTPGRIMAGGTLKPKDLCMIPNRLAIALQDDGWWVRSEIVWGKPNPMPDSSGRYRPSTAHEKLFLLTKSAKSFYDSEAVRMPASANTHSRGYKMPDGWDTGPGGHGSVHRAGREKGRPAAPAPKSQKQGIEVQAYGEVLPDRFLRNYEPDLSPIVPPEVWEIATAAFSEAHFATFPPALVVPCVLAGCPERGIVLDPFGGAGTTGMVADRLGRDAVLIELNPEYAELARKRIAGDAGIFGDVRLESWTPDHARGDEVGVAA